MGRQHHAQQQAGTHANRVSLRSTWKKKGWTSSHHFGVYLNCISIAPSEKGRGWQGLSPRIPMSKDGDAGLQVLSQCLVCPGHFSPQTAPLLFCGDEKLGLIYTATIWKEAAFHGSPTASFGVFHSTLLARLIQQGFVFR